MSEERTCPLGDDCDLTAAYLAGHERGKDKARAEVETLRKENERLREALGFYACACEKPTVECAGGDISGCGWTARAALQGETG